MVIECFNLPAIKKLLHFCNVALNNTNLFVAASCDCKAVIWLIFFA